MTRVVVCALMLAACHRREPEQQTPPVQVRVARALQAPFPVELRGIGRVEALETVEVRARVGGNLDAIHFKEGSDVEKGDLLFEIDPRPYEAVLSQARAAREHDQAQAVQARRDAQRFASLLDRGYVTEQQVSQARAAAEAAAATVHADDARIRAAELDLADTRLRSPITGRVGKVTLTRGNLVKANADQPLVTIHKMQPIGVTFSLPSRELPQIQANLDTGPMSVVAIPTGADRGPRGALSFIDNAVDLATGTIGLRATFLNEDLALWPNEPVGVVLAIAVQPDAIIVPSAAIQQGQRGSYAWVIGDDGHAERREVVVDRSVGDRVVVARGLGANERVVVDGALLLTPGAQTEVQETPENPPPTQGREAPR